MLKKIVGFLFLFLSVNAVFLISEGVNVEASFESNYFPGSIIENKEDWGINKIKGQEALQYESGSKEVLVGIVDTGIDISNNGLESKVDKKLSKSFLDKDEFYEGYGPNGIQYTHFDDPFFDSTGHGTHVAGIIAGSQYEDYRVLGASPNVTLVSLKTGDARGSSDHKDVVEAIEYAESIGVKILNMSMAGEDSKELYDAIYNFSGLVICGAGNRGKNTDDLKTYPSCYNLSNIISVGATDENDERYEKSNYGKTTVDLFAPGVDIISAYPKTICSGENKYEYLDNNHDASHIAMGFHSLTGTSMSTPYVTAVASLMLSRDASYTPDIIKNTILACVDKVDALSEYCVSGGRLNALNVLKIDPHSHSYVMRYYDNHSHIEKCSCGKTNGSYESHYAFKPIGNTNPIYITCLGCKTQLDLRTDFVTYITL